MKMGAEEYRHFERIESDCIEEYDWKCMWRNEYNEENTSLDKEN
jgi:hypothetical protein